MVSLVSKKPTLSDAGFLVAVVLCVLCQDYLKNLTKKTNSDTTFGQMLFQTNSNNLPLYVLTSGLIPDLTTSVILPH